MLNLQQMTDFKYRQTQLIYIIYFIVATGFDLILSTSGHKYNAHYKYCTYSIQYLMSFIFV